MRCSTWKLLGLLCIMLGTSAPAHTEVRIGVAGPLGVLGERIEVVWADDYCEGAQAVAAANKLVAAGVVAVVGHLCSGAAIPASKVYADAGLLMISSFATNPKLTEQGFNNVFRMVGRDDLQGRIAGDLLAERWGNNRIAILHDGQAYGRGLADEAKKRLNERGIAEAVFEAIEPGKVDYWDVIQEMRVMGVEVLYYGGYPHEAGLLVGRPCFGEPNGT